MARNKEIYRIQEERQKKFPPDRIAFMQTGKCADEDARAIEAFSMGECSLAMLCAQIAYNNYLDRYFPNGMIPEELMINELKILGEWIEE